MKKTHNTTWIFVFNMLESASIVIYHVKKHLTTYVLKNSAFRVPNISHTRGPISISISKFTATNTTHKIKIR